ncbi:MAG: hypothetical protein WED04_10850 [Promethearchaeati archaeon SRVP18_Atabeyarchaeia-1]
MMIRTFLSFNRKSGVEIIASNGVLSPHIKKLLSLKSLPLGLPPDEVLKSFPVGETGTAVSYYKMSVDSGFGCAFIFTDRRDVDLFQYEGLLRESVKDGLDGDFVREYEDEPGPFAVPRVRIPGKFDSALQSLVGGKKVMVVGEDWQVRNMIAFMTNLIPRDFRGCFGLTLWCNSVHEEGNLVGLPLSLIGEVESEMDGGQLGAIVDMVNSSVLGTESTEFSKELARRIEQGQIDYAKAKILTIFSNASSLSPSKLNDKIIEPETTRLVAERFFGYSGNGGKQSWIERF